MTVVGAFPELAARVRSGTSSTKQSAGRGAIQ